MAVVVPRVQRLLVDTIEPVGTLEPVRTMAPFGTVDVALVAT